jgi:hypothetical protein
MAGFVPIALTEGGFKYCPAVDGRMAVEGVLARLKVLVVKSMLEKLEVFGLSSLKLKPSSSRPVTSEANRKDGGVYLS